MTDPNRTDLSWLLEDLVRGLPDADSAVLLSTDGLLMGHSSGLDRDDAERFAAMASAFHSLARSAGSHFKAGGVCQTVVELDRAVLFVTAAGGNACLSLLAADSADLGMVAYEMNRTVQQVGAHLGVDSRTYQDDRGRPGPYDRPVPQNRSPIPAHDRPGTQVRGYPNGIR
ncbi:roadblock/LC7 domain-containing protein [Nocardia flavorosea]|uniref:Roadblock/LC7 domain-containing protein n=1 Tax=Nocardia flavorosea TaxID=53429 RepID=A0A846YMI5_9NOCA|nr:roadblock/LC7 domain-containing protein [Nocardia flavorosea]NKY58478.1 roadblock/LC7 domain-containing protein [Nocardia flavorosea]